MSSVPVLETQSPLELASHFLCVLAVLQLSQQLPCAFVSASECQYVAIALFIMLMLQLATVQIFILDIAHKLLLATFLKYRKESIKTYNITVTTGNIAFLTASRTLQEQFLVRNNIQGGCDCQPQFAAKWYRIFFYNILYSLINSVILHLKK